MKFSDNPFSILFGIISIGLGIIAFLDKRLANITDPRIQWALLGTAVVIALVVFLAKVKAPVGYLLLAFFLGYLWAISYFNLSFDYRDLILGVIPIAAGIFLIMGL